MSRRHQVLLVEDNLPDIVLAQKALSVLVDTDVTIAMSAENGLAALAVGNIDLVLLDLNLPKISGFEFLKRMRTQLPRYVPVVVVTSSSAEDDVLRAYEAGASGYLIKPLSLRQYQDMAGKLGAYWFQTCRLPAR